MPHPQGTDDFDFSLVGTDKVPFMGYISSQDPTKTDIRYMIRGAKNVYLKNTGTIAVRPGLKLIGTADATQDGVVASYEFETAQGTTLPIYVLESGKMYFTYQGEDILMGTFDRTRFVFALWWDNINKIEDLIMVNGDHNLYRWNAGIANYGSSAAESTNAVTAVATPASQSVSGTYAVGDILTITGGGGTGAQVKVLAVNGSAPLTYQIIALGSGYAVTSGAATTGGGGTGATVDITEVNDTYTLTNNSGDTWAELDFNGIRIPSTTSATTDNIQDGGLLININGTEFSYFGGTDTDTLTGVIGNPAAAVGDIIFQAISTVENTPSADITNDFVVTLSNQLIVGSYSAKIIYISSDEDFSDFTNNGDLVSGDPDFAIIDEFPTGAVVKGESVYIFAGNASTYVITPNTPVPFAVSVGGSYTLVVTKVEKQVGSGNSAAIAQEFITTIGEDVLYLSKDHQLRQLGTLRNIITQKTPSLSKAVRKELVDEDFTGGALRAVDEFVYITAPISGRTYLYQIRDNVDDVGNLTAQRFWQPPQDWNISRIAIVDGVVGGYSAQYPQLYQLWDTGQYHDDTPDGEGAAYTAVLRMAYRQFKERDDLGSFDKVYYEGYILPRSDLVANVYNDYQGATKVQTKTLSSIAGSAVLYGGDGVTLIGGRKIGDQTIGGGLRDVDYENPLPKFRVISNVTQEDCFEYCLELVSQEKDSQWEILALGPDASTSLNKPVNLQL
jgi:hypothetical protein